MNSRQIPTDPPGSEEEHVVLPGEGRSVGPERFFSAFVVDPDVIHQRLEDQMVLIHLRTNQIYDLTRTATRFCELLFDGQTPEACLTLLAQEYDVDSELLHREIDGVLQVLIDNEIVRVAR